MCGVNIANVAVLLAATNSFKGLLGTFVSVLSSMLISRLMLNLRDAKAIDPTGSVGPLSHANMVFAMQPRSTVTNAGTQITSV